MSLLSSLLMLVVSLALMAAESVFLVQETRLSEQAVLRVQDPGSAEVAIAQTLEAWDPRNATRVGPGLYLVNRSGLGLLVRLRPVGFPAAALISGGSVTLPPGAEVEGAADSGASGSGLVGDLDLDQVSALADLTIPGGRYGSLPSAPGDGVLHIQGNAEVLGGDGRGVLLIDGDLTVTGPLTFSGVILVRGKLVVSGSSALSTHLNGSVVTLMSVTGDSSLWLTYDKTLVDKVLSKFGAPEKLRARSWTSLSQMG